MIESQTDIEEIRDRNGDIARPAADETLAQVLDAVSGGGDPGRVIDIQLNTGESVTVPDGCYWEVSLSTFSIGRLKVKAPNGDPYMLLDGDTANVETNATNITLHAGMTLTETQVRALITGWEVDYA